MPPERVRAILDSESGTHFDGTCVEVCDADLIAHATTERTPVRHVA